MVEYALWGLREPVMIEKEDFETGIIKEGAYAGIPFVRLKESYKGQKGKKLSLKESQTNTLLTDKRTLPCPFSPHPYSCYQTTIKLLKLVPDNCQGVNRIFWNRASVTQIEVRLFLVFVLIVFALFYYF